MIWVLFIVVGVLLVGGVAALVTGRVGYDPMSEPVTSQADPDLGEDFDPAEVAEVRFDTALRGYRMDQVDAVLDRLQARIEELEDAARTTKRQNEPADTEPAHTEPADTEPADTEPADTEPADTEPAHTEPAHTEPAHTEPAHTEP